ncbi:MAG TPA: gamma-glutamylcyclotransferase [Paenalcaligenes sp.]|nr:gamma-glutamylcyclotransferase [Paenalcaligenes sp.]
MLSRDVLSSGAFLSFFQDLPGFAQWPAERIEASMQEMLAKRPEDSPVWLFAYGSLIWNPLIHFTKRSTALLEGWRRSFCLRLVAGRGSSEQPGRMMSLASGGTTSGLAIQLDESNLEEELRLVWVREMVGGAYCPVWAPVTLADGRVVQAIIFTANPKHPLHEPDDALETVAPLIAQASGPLGSNRDYVLKLDHALQEHGLCDAYIHALAGRLALAGS